jgi:hypothetical protein
LNSDKVALEGGAGILRILLQMPGRAGCEQSIDALDKEFSVCFPQQPLLFIK